MNIIPPYSESEEVWMAIRFYQERGWDWIVVVEFFLWRQDRC